MRIPRLALSLLVVVTAAVVPLAGADAAPATAAPLRAGAGMGDITPPVGTPQFAYTAREAAASGVAPFLSQEDFDTNLYAKTFIRTVGVHTRVKSRALVLESGGRKVALVALDLGGFPYDLHQEVARRIAATGISRDRLLMSATHSHGSVGPIWPPGSPGYAVLGGDAFDPRVYDIVADGIAESIFQADAALTDAVAGVAAADTFDATNNRAKEAFRSNRDYQPPAPGTTEEDPKQFLAPAATVLRVDTAGGKPLGIWSNFSIHGTSFGDKMLHFTGDNMAVSERLVEEGIRARAGAVLRPDDVVVNAQSNGPEGDISPRGDSPKVGDVPGAIPTGVEAIDYPGSSYVGAEQAGKKVARALLAAWEAAGTQLQRDVAIDARFTQLALVDPVFTEPIGPDPVLGCGGVVCDDGERLPEDTPGQGAKVPLARGPLNPVNAPMQVLRVGDLVIATAPFEITKQMGQRITDAVRTAVVPALPGDHVVLAGLANGYLSYTSTPEEYEAYAYEGSFTLWGRQQGPYLQRSLVSLAGALAGGTAAPAGVEPPSTAFTSPNTPPVAPEGGLIGEVRVQPTGVQRFQQARMTWAGGDPAADDPTVRVQRREGSEWVTHTTDDSYEDQVSYARIEDDSSHEWSEVWEPSVCTPTGTYRFQVQGMSAKNGAYFAQSQPFALTAAPAPTPGAVRLGGGQARVKTLYAAPTGDTLRVRPRLGTGGGLTMEIVSPGGARRLAEATFEPSTYDYVVDGVAAGETASVVPGSIGDGCGNGRVFAAEPVVPEAPLVPLVALAALGVLGATVAVRRIRA